MSVIFNKFLMMFDVLKNTPADLTNQFLIHHIENYIAELDKTFTTFLRSYKHVEQNYETVFRKSL